MENTYEEIKHHLLELKEVDVKALFDNNVSKVYYSKDDIESLLAIYLFERYNPYTNDNRPFVFNCFGDNGDIAKAAVVTDVNYIVSEIYSDRFKELDSFFDGFGNSCDYGVQYATKEYLTKFIERTNCKDYFDIVCAFVTDNNKKTEDYFDKDLYEYWKYISKAVYTSLKPGGIFLYVTCRNYPAEFIHRKSVMTEIECNKFLLKDYLTYFVYNKLNNDEYTTYVICAYQKPIE